jgi:hypothetical protein
MMKVLAVFSLILIGFEAKNLNEKDLEEVGKIIENSLVTHLEKRRNFDESRQSGEHNGIKQ